MTQRQLVKKLLKEKKGTQEGRVIELLAKERPITSFKGMMTAKVSSWHKVLTNLREQGLRVTYAVNGGKQNWYMWMPVKMSQNKMMQKIKGYEKRYYN